MREPFWTQNLWFCVVQIWVSDFLFPLQPSLPPIPTIPPGCPTREGLISVHVGSVWLRLGSVLGPFRVRGWGRGEGLL